MKTLFLFLSIFFYTQSYLSSQVRIQTGDISFLKGEKEIAISFSYNGTSVGKFKNEADYVSKKVLELNEKEAGRGDTWKNAWENDKESRYKPKFLDLISKYTSKKGPLNFQDNKDGTKYTFLVNIDFLEPGFNAYVVKKYAEVRMTISIVESNNPNTIIAKLSVGGVGRTFGYGDMDTGTRISEAFAKAGKDLGVFITKKALK